MQNKRYPIKIKEYSPFPPLAALAKRFNDCSFSPVSFELTIAMATNSRLTIMILKHFI